MARGILEVQLIGARKLRDDDFIGKMDPYVKLTYNTQEYKSNIASGEGSDPEWNETFVFEMIDDVVELSLKVMDKDKMSEDDYVGEAKIHLRALLAEGSIAPIAYYVLKDDEYRGKIGVGLKFIPEEEC